MKKVKFSKFYLIITVIFFISYMGLLTYRTSNIKEIVINDEFKNYYLETYADSVEELLADCKIVINENDNIVQGSDVKITDGIELTIERSFDITIFDGSSSKSYSTTKHSVRKILNENNIEISEDDIITPFIDAKISEGSSISITRVRNEYIKENVAIPFTTEINLVDDLDDTQVKTISKGIDGLKEVEIKVRYENDKIISRNLVRENTLTDPVSEIKNKGRESMFVTSRGMPFRYSKILIMSSSAYDLSFASCGKYPGDPAYGITYTGTNARPGVIAVDPRVIPFNSTIYIESLDNSSDYGFAHAEDTGSAIIGNRIDLFIGDHMAAMRYGRRQVRIYIIEEEIGEEYFKGYGY